MSAIREAISRLTTAQSFGIELAGDVAGEILGGEATGAQIGAFLAALRSRGEQPEHLLGFARAMRSHCAAVENDDRAGLVDTCGTGGDGSGTFNISTCAAFIAAGAGVRVAKHGNRAIGSRCGSADVLETLGVNVEMSPQVAAQCLNEAGFTFFFAPVFHKAMRHAGPPRREIGIPTIFNMLGPLANPAGALRQVVGVYDGRLTSMLAGVLLELGSAHAMVVHGEDGLDEITLTGPTLVAEAKDGSVKSWTIRPEELGLERTEPEKLRGGDAKENAAIIRAILGGEEGPRRTVAELNASAALVVAGRASSLMEGLQQARQSIESGSAARVLERLIALSNAGPGQ